MQTVGLSVVPRLPRGRLDPLVRGRRRVGSVCALRFCVAFTNASTIAVRIFLTPRFKQLCISCRVFKRNAANCTRLLTAD